VIIFINPYTNKLTKDKMNAIPINIETELNILHDIKDGYLPMYKLDTYGKMVYTDYCKNETTEMNSFLEIGEKKKIGNLDYYEQNVMSNSHVTFDKYRTEMVKVTEENYDQFNLDEILNLEYENILNDTEYYLIVSNILDNVIIAESSFKSLNKYRCILDVNDNIEIIFVVTGSSINTVQFRNLDPNLNVTVNNESAYRNGDLLECNFKQNDVISIKITNNTDKKIIIVNPYLLCM
jgi:hypothetical protein